MSEESLAFICLVGIFGGLALICFIIAKVMDFIYKRKDRKHHREHPEFFRLCEDFNEKAKIARRFYNSEIAPRKSKVDYMLKDVSYWPREVRELKMEEAEGLRREIYIAEATRKRLNKETDEARQKVADYVHANNIKWAGDWD
jgi:hypothetical protein